MLLKPRMILKLIASLVLVALVQPAGAFQIRRVGTDSGVVLKLRGDVRAGDYDRSESDPAKRRGCGPGDQVRRRLPRRTASTSRVSCETRASSCTRPRNATRRAPSSSSPRRSGTSAGVAKSECIPFPTIAGRKTATASGITVTDVAASGRTRSAAFRHRQNRRDASGQDDLSGQSRSGRAERAPNQSLPEHP